MGLFSRTRPAFRRDRPGASWDPGLEEEIGRVVSRQEKACGITYIFAPVLDISQDSRMGRQGETYGEDPTLAAALGVAYTKGIQTEETAGRKADAVAKHFLAFHNSIGGIHGADSQTPERLLWEIYGKPFQAAISLAGLRGIMPCYCSLNGEPVSLSKHLLTDSAPGGDGFEGLCVSDYGAIGNAFSYQHVGRDRRRQDGWLCRRGWIWNCPILPGSGRQLPKCSATGRRMKPHGPGGPRVLTEKFSMGLFEHPFALVGKELCREFYDERDRDLPAVGEGISGSLEKRWRPPLESGCEKIALIGPHADSPRKYFGGIPICA